MRELEFLPEWYPRIRRRKRLAILQTWATLILVAALGLWMFVAQRDVEAAEAILMSLDHQQSKTAVELRKLDDLLALQKQWRQQDQIISKLGLHIEAARMIQTLDTVMPREMALLDLSLETEVRPVTAVNLSRARSNPDGEPAADRRLKVRLRGVTPTGVDLANFLMRLSSVPFFDQVNMSYSRDRNDSGHVMREFEVTFSLNLNTPKGS